MTKGAGMGLLRGLSAEQVEEAARIPDTRTSAGPRFRDAERLSAEGIPLTPPTPRRDISEAQDEIARLVGIYGAVHRAAHAYAYQHQVKMATAYSLLHGIHTGRSHGGGRKGLPQKTVQEKTLQRLRATK